MKALGLSPPSLVPLRSLNRAARAPRISQDKGTLQVLGVHTAQLSVPLQAFNLDLQLLVFILQKS